MVTILKNLMKKILVIAVLLTSLVLSKDFLELSTIGRTQTSFDTSSTWQTIRDVSINFEADSCVYFAEIGGGVTVDSIIVEEYSPTNGAIVGRDTLFAGEITTSFTADTTISGSDTTIAHIYTDSVIVADMRARAITNVGYRQNIRYKASMDELGSNPYIRLFRTDLRK